MAKKVLMFFLSVMLIASLTLISCSQDQKKPGPAPQPLEPVENEDGIHSDNLAEGCDFEHGDDYIIKGDGSEIAVVEGAGIGGSHALYVFQNSGEGWGETLIDATKLYGRGKSYYIEATFRNLGGEGTPTTDITGKIDFTVVSGAGWDKYKKTYDIPGQYEFDWLSDDQAFSVFEITPAGQSADLSDGDWHTVSGVLDAETIDTMIRTQTEDHGTGDTEESLYYMAFVFYVGSYPSQDGYKYYIDNIKIIDLNTEIETTGRTWVDPSEDPDDAE